MIDDSIHNTQSANNVLIRLPVLSLFNQTGPFQSTSYTPDLRDKIIGQMFEVDLREWAKQLTLIDHTLFMNIPRHEFLNLSWSRSDRWETAPNLMRKIDEFNQV